jgi:hypothetical protein
MTILDIPRSGRDGAYVYYMRGRKLCRRRYVIPRNVRTAGRARARVAFGAIAKAWSRVLTEAQRRAWNAAAAKVQSRPRLWQSGWLTGQTFFAGINSAWSRIGREMLLWPPDAVVFQPNPVGQLILSRANHRVSLKLSVSGPVVGDIMVFGAAPCSAGRKKWRNGAYLGLLPPPAGGESDITELYLARYGEPEPGKRVFIRTRQQREGWEDHPRDVSGVVVAKAGTAGVEIRSPKPEIRPKAENQGPKHAWSRLVRETRCTREQYRICTGVSPGQYRRSKGREGGMRSAECEVRNGGLAQARRSGYRRELWRGT